MAEFNFTSWRSKPIHSGNVFNADGIVDPEQWSGAGNSPKILFILKEAYHRQGNETKLLASQDGLYDLCSELKMFGPWSSLWVRVAEWIYGICNTTPDSICPYKTLTKQEANLWLRHAAVINIKKSKGQVSSDMEDIKWYAGQDREELAHQIEAINPDLIVCGSTFQTLNLIYSNPVNIGNENWSYKIGRRTVIDYYHPANRYPALLNYYGLVNIYQQTLLRP